MALEDAIKSLKARGRLEREEARAAATALASGECPVEEMVRFLAELGIERLTVDVLTAFVEALRERAIQVTSPFPNAICNCGTGGDGRGTLNFSTMASFVIAACGVPVAKHGNRSVSSRCGSTDLLASLGVAVSATPGHAEASLREEGLCFMNAPDFHPAMRHAAPARAELGRQGRKTIFNVLGPMLNPAGVRRQSMGVFAPRLVELAAETLRRTGTQRAYVFHGDGLDEVTLCGLTTRADVSPEGVRIECRSPGDFGFASCDLDRLKGESVEHNAAVAEAILRGELEGAARDMVIINAAHGIIVGSLKPSRLAEAVALARCALESGAAWEKVEALRRRSRAG